MRLLRCLLLGALGLLWGPSLLAQVPAITNCDSTQTFCATDSIQTACFRILIGTDYNEPIDRFEIDWDDGSERQVISFDSSDNQIFHTFDLSDFYNTCQPTKEYRVDLFTYTADGQEVFNGSRIVFLNPPQSVFGLGDTQGCAGKEVNFADGACPAGVMVEYDYGDGSSGTSNRHVYPDTGMYFITQIATNQCGVDTSLQKITVVEPALVDVDLDTAATASTGSDNILCAGPSARTVVFARLSSDVRSISWTAGPGANILDTTARDSVSVSFDGPGNYEVFLTVDNVCNEPAQDTARIEVRDTSSLQLQATPDNCAAFDYTPMPYDAQVQYHIDETLINTFPFRLATRDSAYTVEARFTDVCGTQLRTDTILVQPPTPVEITYPLGLDPVCNNDATIPLEATQPGGQWQINGNPVDSAFNPVDYGVGKLDIRYRVGSVACATEDSVQVEILPGPNVSVGPDEQLCIDAARVELNSNVAGGTWSGPGVIDANEGHFDPATAGPGVHRLRYSYTSPSDGCTSTAAKKIIVEALPDLALRPSARICEPGNAVDINMLLLDSLALASGTLSWSGPGITDSTGGIFYPAQAGGEGRYTLTARYSVPPGCVQMRSAELIIANRVPAEAMADSALCTSQGVLQLRGTPAGGEWFDAQDNPVAAPMPLDSLSPGRYDFRYVLSRGTSCESSDVTQVTIVPAASVEAGDDLYACAEGSPVQLPRNTGNWSGPELTGPREIATTNLTPGSYAYTLTDPNLPDACNTDILTLYIQAAPDPAFVLDSVRCLSDTILFNNQTTVADRYRWRFGNGASSREAEPQYAYAKTGRYTVSLTAEVLHPVDSSLLCRASTSRPLEIFAAPVKAAFQPDTPQGCAPLQVNFRNQSEGDALQYEWMFGESQTSTLRTPEAVRFDGGRSDTTYQVTLRVANQCGGESLTRPIRVLAEPVAEFATEQTGGYCSGEEVRFFHRSLADSLRWDFGNGSRYAGFEPPNQTYTTGADNDTLQIELIALNECGVDTARQDLVITPSDAQPAISIVDNRPCIGDTVFLQSLSRPREAPVEWVFPDGSTDIGNETFWVFEEAGTQRVRARVYGCGVDSTDLELQVQPAPDLTLSLPGQGCPGNPFRIDVRSDQPNRAIFLGDSLLTDRSRLEYTLDSLGSYRFRGKVTSPEGCTAWAEREIEILPGPEADFVLSDSVCAGTPVELISTSTDALSCNWLLAEASRFTGCSTTYVFAADGPQTAQLTVTNGLGCSDSLRKTVFIYPTPTADFDVELLDPCTPAQVRLISRSQRSTGLQWDLGPAGIANEDTVRYSLASPGNYTVGLRADNDALCVDSIQRNFEVLPRPQIRFDTLPSCTLEEGYELSLSASPPARLSLTGNDYQQEGSLHLGLQAGEYLMSAVTLAGCSQDSFLRIPKVDALTAEILEPDTIPIQLGEDVSLRLDVNRIDATASWLPAELSSDPTGLSTIISTLRSTDVQVFVTDSRGCERVDQVYIQVSGDRDRGVYIPDAFTPDFSGYNDVFRIRSSSPGLDQLRIFRIFGPGGGLVFERRNCDPLNGDGCAWDGTLNGEDVQPGVYGYYAELEYVDGVIVTKKGSVTLIR